MARPLYFEERGTRCCTPGELKKRAKAHELRITITKYEFRKTVKGFIGLKGSGAGPSRLQHSTHLYPVFLLTPKLLQCTVKFNSSPNSHSTQNRARSLTGHVSFQPMEILSENFHKHTKSVTYVSGLFCYLCRRSAHLRLKLSSRRFHFT